MDHRAFLVPPLLFSVARAHGAPEILNAAGVKGGLVVAIGCDSPAMLAELRAGDAYLVHGLDADAEKLQGLTYATVSHEDRARSRASWGWIEVAMLVFVLGAILAAYLYFTG